jgi:recombinational DNA repair protein RecT
MSTELQTAPATPPAPRWLADIQDRKDTLLALLPDEADQRRFMTALTTYVGPRPALHAPALRPSLVLALYQTAKLNLDLGSQMDFIVRGGKVCAEVNFKGAIVLMLRSPGATHVDCFEIRQNDTVRMENGRLVHHEVHTLDIATRGPIIACCARLWFRDGHCIERVIDLDIINNAKKAGGSTLWKDHFTEAVRKTCVLRLGKLAPLDAKTQSVLSEIEANSMAVQQAATPAARRIHLTPEDSTIEAAVDADFTTSQD